MDSLIITEFVKILFVDDERNVLKSLRRLFMDDDHYELFFAESGAEGLQTLEQVDDISVVVSDYRMPEMNGVEFLRKVHERWPKTIRIVLSGYADTASVVEAINIGHIYKFIPKPWDDDELRVNIAKAVEACSLKQQNEKLSDELVQLNEELGKVNVDLGETVKARTRDLELRSQVLQLAQDILDTLPVAVLGVDTENNIVQANSYASKIFVEKGLLLGEKASMYLPDDLLVFLEQVKVTGCARGIVESAGRPFTVVGCFLNDDRRRGVVLTLYPHEEG